jgi:hypothetical protein
MTEQGKEKLIKAILATVVRVIRRWFKEKKA